MNYSALLIIIGIVESGVIAYLLWTKLGKVARSKVKTANTLNEELQKRIALKDQISAALQNMIEVRQLRLKGDEYKAAKESLKAERGRITITQAELETVENRLRELEVIERELEASAVETQEEVNILTKKRNELTDKKVSLEQQLLDSDKKMSDVMMKIELSAQMRSTIDKMRHDLVKTQEQIDVLLEKVRLGNEQYFIMKQRYDALDIEYAQLYEKFSASELASASNEEHPQ